MLSAHLRVKSEYPTGFKDDRQPPGPVQGVVSELSGDITWASNGKGCESLSALVVLPCASLKMAIPQLPIELACRIISTARFLERQEKLHDSRMWKEIRWYVGNGDVHQVPPSWASSWFLELVRALMNPGVRFVHLRSSMAG